VPALAAVQGAPVVLVMVDGLGPVREQSLPHPDSFEAMMLKLWGVRNLPSLLEQITDRAPACGAPNADPCGRD
jgi:hypothetical protein